MRSDACIIGHEKVESFHPYSAGQYLWRGFLNDDNVCIQKEADIPFRYCTAILSFSSGRDSIQCSRRSSKQIPLGISARKGIQDLPLSLADLIHLFYKSYFVRIFFLPERMLESLVNRSILVRHQAYLLF